MSSGYVTPLPIADTLSQTGMPTTAGRSSDSVTAFSTGGCAGWPKQVEAKLTEQTNKRSPCILAATSIHPAASVSPLRLGVKRQMSLIHRTCFDHRVRDTARQSF